MVMDFKDTKLGVAKKFSAEFSWQLYIVFKSKNMPFLIKTGSKEQACSSYLMLALIFNFYIYF